MAGNSRRCFRTVKLSYHPAPTSDGQTIVDHENIQRSRLRVDARKWAAARLAPRKYGDRVEHDVKGGDFQPAILIQVGGGEREDDAKLIEGD